MLNGLIAILAVAAALIMPGELEIVEWRTELEVTPWSVSVYVDPVFVVWTPLNLRAAAMTFGNTIIAEDWLRTSEKRDWIMAYEMQHVEQCRALGWAMWPASLVVDMDPYRGGGDRPSIDWARPGQVTDVMWTAPDWMPQTWHFFRLTARFG